jgi:F-box protein 9
MEESNPELESFRQQWKAEVSARAKAEGGNKGSQSSTAGLSKAIRRPPAAPRISSDIEFKGLEDHEPAEPQSFHDLGNSGSVGGAEHGGGSKSGSREPRSALEHYEKAVERETQGSLGDSLDLYRKAFKVGFGNLCQYYNF